ncbi:hypothetical protein HDV03_003996 [Kappamyces sp. JEL0829]|nr:hypothetical protein HDV03_003996 [Kappamyces sp. JEL0829]
MNDQKPVDYAAFLTATSASRKHSAIRAMQKYLSVPGMVNLGGGLPNPQSFPFTALSLTLADGTRIDVSSEALQKGLQYGMTKSLQEQVHAPPYEFDVMIGHGSQDLMCKAYEMLVAPGDTILMESPTYVGVLAFLRPYGAKMVEVATDGQGLIASSLDDILAQWNVQEHGPRPRVLYTVATAGNPTGVTTPTQRKKEVYAVCSKYNVLILEDDPYYYLQYDQPLEQSYFSMDRDGRVLRFDSFSKVLSAGARLGFVTGPPALIERMVMHQMSTTLNASGLSQLLLWEFLKTKGVQGFLEHTRAVASLYKERRDLFIGYLTKHLAGKAEWHTPTAGMFCWIKLKNVQDSSELIATKAVQAGVLLVPGKEFYPNARTTSFLRASFSYSSPQDMEEGVRRLASLLP